MSFLKTLKSKYSLVVAKTRYLEDQIDDLQEKLKAFKKQKPTMLTAIAKSDLKSNEKESERSKLESVESYLEMSISDLKDAIKWRDKTGTEINNEKDLSLAPSGKKMAEHKLPSFSILPGITCPGKRECFGWCYAMGGHPMAWKAKSSPARAMQARYLGLAERDDWEERMSERLKKIAKDRPFRIHVTGDFHSPEYVKKWIELIKKHPDRQFYAYTKSHQMDGMKELENLPNMTLRYSYGGKDDDKIDPKKPHCKVFETEQELKDAGYTECKADDRIAADKHVIKMGIVKHGTRRYQPKTFQPHSHASVVEYPVAHLFDQIDAPHHWSEEEEKAHNDLGAHQTPNEWTKHWGI
jgi:hypothetical protein